MYLISGNLNSMIRREALSDSANKTPNMKNSIYLLSILLVLFSCNRNSKTADETVDFEISLSAVSFAGLKGKVADAKTGDASINVLVNGALLKTLKVVKGAAKFEMPVHGLLEMKSGDFCPNNPVENLLEFSGRDHLIDSFY